MLIFSTSCTQGLLTSWRDFLHTSTYGSATSFFFFKIDFFFPPRFICLFFGCAESLLLHAGFSSCREQGLLFIGCTLVEECILVALFIVVPRLLDVVASVVVVHGL